MNDSIFFNISKLFATIGSEHVLRGKFKFQGDPCENNELVALEQNVANILLSCEAFHCILKIHYSYRAGENIQQQLYKRENASKLQIDDLFKENCNQIAGRFKKVLSDKGVSISISIPVRTRGYDEFFFDRKDFDEQSKELSWQMSDGANSFYMSTFIEVLNKNKVNEINFELDSGLEATSDNFEDEVELF